MKTNKFKISKEQILKMERASRRREEIELGFIPTHKVHKNKKAYSRKENKRINFD